MELDTFKPTFLIQIEGQTLSKDITQEITSFSFTDNEAELDVLELCVTNRNLQFVDDPLFQEGNEIVARFGYVDNLSPRKKAVIKDIDYDFPESGDPTIRIKAYDKGFKLAGKENQKVWQRPAPGILYSEIAEEIAASNGLKPVIQPTHVRHLRVTQSNLSDAQFLRELAAKARGQDGEGVTGYVFFVQDDELHFHPRELGQTPALALEYFTDRKGLLRSFTPSTQSQGAKGCGTETHSIGVDPRKKAVTQHKANNATTPERPSLGKKTYLVNGNTGEATYREQETGQVQPSYERSEAFDEEPRQEPAQDLAEGKFREAELRQVEADAATIGIPSLKAKQNIEIKGVGRKFSGVYYCHSVRHSLDGNGYSCELKLKRNALGKGAGAKSEAAKGKPNETEAPATPQETPPPMVTVDAETGAVRKG
jgi:phage protein D